MEQTGIFVGRGDIGVRRSWPRGQRLAIRDSLTTTFTSAFSSQGTCSPSDFCRSGADFAPIFNGLDWPGHCSWIPPTGVVGAILWMRGHQAQLLDALPLSLATAMTCDWLWSTDALILRNLPRSSTHHLLFAQKTP